MEQTITPQQIAQYAYNAGFRGRDLLIAVAVALRESGGNPKAYNPETAAGTAQGSGSRGLWQIYGTAHPWANGPQVFDPQANANAAYRVWREAGGRWTPWSTWTNGSALTLLPSLSRTLNPSRITSGTPTRITQAIRTTPVLSVPGVVSSGGVVTGYSSGGGLSPLGQIRNTTNTIGTSIQETTQELNPVTQFLESLGISKKDNTGPTDFLDWASMFGGLTLIVIGLIALFFISGAAEKTGKAVATVAKVAAV